MPKSLHEHLNDALKSWIKVTGEDPNKSRWNFSSWRVKESYDELTAAQKLDPTGLTTAMLLRAFIEEWALDATYSANDLINSPTAVMEEVGRMREVIKILERDEIKIPTEEFLENLKVAVKHYNIDDPDTDKLLEDQFEIAYIRRDAMLAINKLSSYQFLRGKSSKDSISYSNNIYQFWNVNSLIKSITQLPISAVVLALIRDEEAYHSYFAFALRNGGNVSVLTDKTEWAHPEQKNMIRRLDKEFSRRAFMYHFPYSLLDIYIGEDERVHIPKQKCLVKYNSKHIVLGKMNQVPASSMIWLTMMLTLINDRYWVQNDNAKLLSYTGEMAAYPKVLQAASKNLPVLRYTTLALPKIGVEDLETSKLEKTQKWERKPTKFNEWMLERYGDKVPAEALNLIGNKDMLLLPSGKVKKGGKKFVKSFFDSYKEDSLDYAKEFKGLDPTEFGTRKKLIKDAQWCARHNQATIVSALAEEEYKRDKEKVKKWFREKVQKNKESLMLEMATGKFIATTQVEKGSFDFTKEEERNILRLQWFPSGYPWIYSSYTDLIGELTRDSYRCALTGLRASVFCMLRPKVPAAIAKIAGCREEDLPFGLRKYYVNEPYKGNCILSRLDPMDWVGQNPWKKLNIVVLACFTKRAFNSLRKKIGLPIYKKEDWEKIKKDEEK